MTPVGHMLHLNLLHRKSFGNSSSSPKLSDINAVEMLPVRLGYSCVIGTFLFARCCWKLLNSYTHFRKLLGLSNICFVISLGFRFSLQFCPSLAIVA